MFYLSLRTAARKLRIDDGNILITTVLVAMLIGMLASLSLVTGSQADRFSTSDRNHEQSLGVAEAAVNRVISRIDAQWQGTDSSAPALSSMTTGQVLPSGCATGGACPAARTDPAYSATTPQGSYWYWVTRTKNGYIIDAESISGGTQLERGRHVQVTLEPPLRFTDGTAYALFSYTSIDIQNNDQVLDGDVFANDNISIAQSNHNTHNDPTLKGSLTAARGWINLDNGVYILGNVWSGGPNFSLPAGSRWAIKLGATTVEGWAKASATTLPSPCASNSDYNVSTSNGAKITGNLTTLGSLVGGASVGSYSPSTCTSAAPTQPLPTFTFNRNNYGPDAYAINTCPSARNGVCEFSSVTAFQTWLSANGSDFRGAFLVNASNPSQSTRIDLTGAQLTGSATVISDAPIYTGTLNDGTNSGGGNLVVVSHYKPPTSTVCDSEHDNSECAVHIKNNFALNADGSCRTATLVYADRGPVAIKNGQTLCGSVISNGIVVKNGQTVTYDGRIARVIGFGTSTYGVSRWLELPTS